TPVASGAPYAVAVQAHPTNPWQTCAVANASGTVGAANVVNVAVSCTTNTYAVGGTITGLVGSGLTLTNNGGHAITIAPGATAFTFRTRVPSGQPYFVRVSAPPSAPTQTCTVTGSSGTVGGTNVNTVVVNCATNTYTISGTVTGLLGSGLILNDGTNAI